MAGLPTWISWRLGFPAGLQDHPRVAKIPRAVPQNGRYGQIGQVLTKLQPLGTKSQVEIPADC